MMGANPEHDRRIAELLQIPLCRDCAHYVEYTYYPLGAGFAPQTTSFNKTYNQCWNPLWVRLDPVSGNRIPKTCESLRSATDGIGCGYEAQGFEKKPETSPTPDWSDAAVFWPTFGFICFVVALFVAVVVNS
jgi:hypothetical protein